MVKSQSRGGVIPSVAGIRSGRASPQELGFRIPSSVALFSTRIFDTTLITSLYDRRPCDLWQSNLQTWGDLQLDPGETPNPELLDPKPYHTLPSGFWEPL